MTMYVCVRAHVRTCVRACRQDVPHAWATRSVVLSLFVVRLRGSSRSHGGMPSYLIAELQGVTNT